MKIKLKKKWKYVPQYLQEYLIQGFDFKSKTKRRNYFLSQVQYYVSFFVLIFLYTILISFEKSITNTENLTFSEIFLCLPVGLYLIYGFWCQIPNSVRRLRDAGFSPWWVLLPLAPFGALFLFIMHTQPSKNEK